MRSRHVRSIASFVLLVGVAVFFAGATPCTARAAATPTAEISKAATPAEKQATAPAESPKPVEKAPAPDEVAPAADPAAKATPEEDDATPAPVQTEPPTVVAPSRRPERNEPFSDENVKALEEGLKPLSSVPAVEAPEKD